MKTGLMILALFVSSTVLADVYNISVEYQTEAAKTQKRNVLVKDGRSGVVHLDNDTTIKVTPTQREKGVVKIEAVIRSLQDGKLATSRASAITRLGQAAELTQKSQNGSRWYRLKMNPVISGLRQIPTQPLDLMDGQVRTLDN